MAKWLGLFLAWFTTCVAAVTVVDDRGVQVTIHHPPQRIVTLLPSLAETVCMLGECNRLVGTDNHANWPAQVKALPKLGGLDDTSVEALVRLKPDLVLLARSSRNISRFESLGLKVLALEPQNMADVKRVMYTVAQAMLLPQADVRADELWQHAMKGIASAKQQVPAGANGAMVYFEASTGGYAAGEASFIGEIMLEMGLRNIVPARMGPFPQLNPEYVVRAKPQIILLGEPMAVGLHKRPGWASMEAVQRQRICAFKAAEGDVLVRPGPRLGEAAQLMATCLQKHFTP
jgi:iron complex transport system substrate-binding protein